MKRRLRILLYALPVIFVIGLVAIAWYQREQRTAFFSDAATIRAPYGEAAPRDILWEPAVRLPGILNTAGNEFEPSVTSDGLTLFFVRGRAAHDADIFTSVRTPNGWTEPAPLLEINTDADELGPEPSADGSALYFYSDRAGGQGGYDLWVARRIDDGWAAPVNLGPAVNSRGHDYGPCLAPDGTALYFASDRPPPTEETAVESEPAFMPTAPAEQHDYDLYVARLGENGFDSVAAVVPLNSPANEGAPAFSASGDFLYFASDRDGGRGGFDLYRSRLVRDEFRAPSNLGDSINTPDHELDPALTLGGFGIHFSSDRPRTTETDAVVASNGMYDLYFAQSREVFVETETYRARINWAALLAAILPYLIWLLLTLTLLGVLTTLLHRLEYNKMGLLTKCMVGSLLAHLILLLLLTIWGVSTSLSEAISPGSATRVVLLSPSIGNGIAEQLQGELTEVELETEAELAEQQNVETEIDQPQLDEAQLAVEAAELESFESLDAETDVTEAQAVAAAMPELQPVQEFEQATPLEHATPDEAQREQTDEAVAQVPDRAVSEPAAARDEAMEPAEQPLETQVAMNVERIEFAPESESMAEPEDSTEAQQETSETLMALAPSEVNHDEAREMNLPSVPQATAQQAAEASATMEVARRSSSKQSPAETDISDEVQPRQVELEAPPNREALAMRTMAQPEPARTAEVNRPMDTQTAADVTPRAVSDAVELRRMPASAAVAQGESNPQLQVAVAATGRTDAAQEFESAGAPVQQIETNPEATRIVASDSMAQSLTMSEAATQASPLPEMRAHLDEASAAESELALSTPTGSAPTETVTEAQGQLSAAAASAARVEQLESTSDLATATAEVTMPTHTTPLTVASSSMARTEAQENTTEPAHRMTPTTDASVAAQDRQSVELDMPAEQATGQTSESMLPAAAVAQLPSSTSEQRFTRTADAPAATPNETQVSVTPTRRDLDTRPQSLTSLDTRSSALPSSAPVRTESASDVAVEAMHAASLDLPTDLSAPEANPAARGERTLAPLLATASSSRRSPDQTMAPAAPSNRAVQVEMAPTSTPVADASSSMALRESREARPSKPSALPTDESRTMTLAPADAMALKLPTERDQPSARPAAAPANPRIPIQPRRTAKFTPRQSPLIDTAATVVAMTPSSTPQQSAARPLLENVYIADRGASPLLSPPLRSSENSEGMVIPPLAAVQLPGMEQTTRRENAERGSASAGTAQPGRRGRLGDAFIEAPDREIDRRRTTEWPAVATTMIHDDRLFSPRDVARARPNLAVDVALPLLDTARLDVPDRLDEDLGLRLPLEQHAPINPYQQRADEFRDQMVEIMGGSRETEQAVALALDWLARHQSSNGSWDGNGFDDDCGECRGRAKVQVDIGLTGLSLLCFLAADHTHLKDGPYQETVRRGLQWLVRRQRRDGSMLASESLYSHGIATIALAEAYGMTGDPELAQPLQSAIDFIYAARNRGVGGWRYGPGQVGDTSVLGWQIMAMKSADRAGISVPDQAFDVGRRWLDLVSRSVPDGLYRYQPDGEVTPAMVAEGLFVRQLLGGDPEATHTQASVDYILERLPDWDECNVYYWYYATLAMFQHQGEAWDQWNEHVKDVLLEHQYRSGRRSGSWDPEGQWAGIGGRIYQTAVSTLILEVYYRYLPTFVGDTSTPARSAISGSVTDAISGNPLPGAVVRLDLSAGRSVNATADPTGRYTLLVPDVPEFIAVSASRPGYTPETINVAEDEVKQRSIVRNFELTPIRDDVVAVELDPDVHHLGNDEFTGRINSQFQKRSEGLVYQTTFSLEATQLPAADRNAEIRLLVRGAQAPNPIFINGNLVLRRISRAPRDGSFGEFRTDFPVSWLFAGDNLIEIRSVRGDSDLDDYEFVNIRIVLNPDAED